MDLDHTSDAAPLIEGSLVIDTTGFRREVQWNAHVVHWRKTKLQNVGSGLPPSTAMVSAVGC